MSTATAIILDEAADVLRRNGWYQGSFCDDGSLRKTDVPSEFPCCAYGAINLAANRTHPRKTSPGGEYAYKALAQYLGISDEAGNTVADWNDDPFRTADQVIAALQGAARAEREAES